MFSTRSLKLLVLLGLTAVIVISMGARISTGAMSQSVQVPERRGSSVEYPALPSAARVRDKIPSDFIQPVVPYDPSEISPDDYIRAAGPHTIRDEIPSEFIYPLASDSAGTVHENIAERSFELRDRETATNNSTAIRGALATSTNVSTAISVSPGSARPPELHNSAQAPDPAGYWDTVSPASSGLNQGTVRPRRCTVPLEGGTWLATGTC